MLHMLIPLLSKAFVIHHWILKRLENFACNFAETPHFFFGCRDSIIQTKEIFVFKETTILTFDQLLGFFTQNYGLVVLYI